ncbi:MAG: hypothetical protein AAF547_23610 [Actinomycetota bacterium]
MITKTITAITTVLATATRPGHRTPASPGRTNQPVETATVDVLSTLRPMRVAA